MSDRFSAREILERLEGKREGGVPLGKGSLPYNWLSQLEDGNDGAFERILSQIDSIPRAKEAIRNLQMRIRVESLVLEENTQPDDARVSVAFARQCAQSINEVQGQTNITDYVKNSVVSELRRMGEVFQRDMQQMEDQYRTEIEQEEDAARRLIQTLKSRLDRIAEKFGIDLTQGVSSQQFGYRR